MIEIEKRVQIEEAEFESTLTRLKEKYGQPTEKRFMTVLLKGMQSHGRIRKIFGSDTCIFTTKSGEVGDTIRQEDNIEYKMSELDTLKTAILAYNFNKALTFETSRYTFKHGSLSIDLSDHGIFGSFLEVEQVVVIHDQQDISVKQIEEIFRALNMQPMPSVNYKNHMDQIFTDYAQPLEELNLSVVLNA